MWKIKVKVFSDKKEDRKLQKHINTNTVDPGLSTARILAGKNLDKHPNQGGVVLQVAASCEGNLGGHLA